MTDDKKAKKEDKPKDSPKDSKDPKAADEKGKEGAEGAEGAAAAPAEGAASGFRAKFPPKKILLFIVLPLLIIIGIGAGAYFMGFFGKKASKEQLNCEKVKEGDENYVDCLHLKEDLAGGKPGAFLTMPDMIVNLSTTGKQARFLKVTLKIELESAEEQKKMEPIMPRVIDQFQMYLRELRIEDLRGTSGIYRMKIELLNRVRAAAPGVKVRDVLFQEMLVQ